MATADETSINPGLWQRLRGAAASSFDYVRSYFPQSLPKGLTELELFSQSIFKIYKLSDHPSFHHAVATMIMHLGPTTHKKSKRYFAVSIFKTMANQVAYEKIQQIKEAENKTITEKSVEEVKS